jgi:hypothetical protein
VPQGHRRIEIQRHLYTPFAEWHPAVSKQPWRRESGEAPRSIRRRDPLRQYEPLLCDCAVKAAPARTTSAILAQQ